VQQESKIMGYMDANGNYVRTPFRDAYENGGMFVFEEFDGSSARALLAANNATANEYTDFPDKMVKRHEKFVCVMAGNTFGTGASRQYVGRQQLDAATLDRFAFLEVGYDEAIELAAAKQFNDDAGAWVKRVQKFRAKVEAAGIKHVVSPRASIMGAKLLKQGMPEQLVVEMLLHKSLSADQIAQLSA
jgi:MoxR-like ATPase